MALTEVPPAVTYAHFILFILGRENNGMESGSLPPGEMAGRESGHVAQNVWFAEKMQERSLKYKFATTELCNDLAHFSRN